MFCEDLLGRVSSQPLMTVSEDWKRSPKCPKYPKYDIGRSEESEVSIILRSSSENTSYGIWS
jgi:hypothetical protein